MSSIAACLLPLVEFPVTARRTTLTGHPSNFDALVLAPGMQCQQSACDQSVCNTRNEVRMASSFPTKDILPVKNPPIMSFLQSIARPGHLVTARVHPFHNTELPLTTRRLRSFFVTGVSATLLYLLCPTLTVTVAVYLGLIRDWRGIGVLVMFTLSRLINMVVVRRRSKRREVAREPGVERDLLVLLSQDRWVRLRGMLDDLKLVALPQWREKSAMEGLAVFLARLLVYAAVALCSIASTTGILTIACLLLCSSAFLGLCNVLTQCLQVFDCVLYMEGEPEKYSETDTTIIEMMDKIGKHDWATGMGFLVSTEGKDIEM